jgi:nucleoid DNA-binding protein
MTKQELINKVSQETGQTKAAIAETINSTISTIQNAVANGSSISFQGFVSFTPIIKKALEGEINGNKYSKPERQGVRVKVMKTFKELVENGVQGAEDVQDEK